MSVLLRIYVWPGRFLYRGNREVQLSANMWNYTAFRTKVRNMNFCTTQQSWQNLGEEGRKLEKCQTNVDFSDHNTAFQKKTTKEILRAWFVFKLCCVDYFVDNSMRIFNLTRRLLGDRLLCFFLKPTIYTHFGVVETEDNIRARVASLHKLGIKSLLSPMQEEEVGQAEGNINYDENVSRFIRCMELASQLCTEKPKCVAMKLTAVLPVSLLAAISKVQKSDILKKHVVEEIAALISGNISQAHMLLLQPHDEKSLQEAAVRLCRLGDTCLHAGVTLFIDAEHSYLQPAVRMLTLSMMARFNKQSPAVWNTYQCYLKKSFDHVKNDVQLSEEMGFWFGGKLVRGAYLEIEREYSRTTGKPYPLNDNYEETSAMYHRVMDFILSKMSSKDHRCAVIFGTHNEDSVRHALGWLSPGRIDPLTGGVHFAQQCGMCEHVSLTLGRNGYSVYKLVPVGSVIEVLPWLSRRVSENRSILDGAKRDREILWKQLKSRLHPDGRN